MFSWGRSSVVSNYPGGGTATGSSVNSSSPASSQSSNANYIIQPHTRAEHLQSYLTDSTLKPSTRRVSGDDTTYDTVFQTKSGHALILRVHLPSANSSSGSTRPAMTLVGVKATHLWLDRKMRVVGFSPMSSEEQWAQSRLKLGDAVNRVVKHLQLYPPNVIEITDESLKRLQASIKRQQNNNDPNNNNPNRNPSANSNNGVYVPESFASSAQPSNEAPIPINLPSVPHTFAELATMSRSEMRDLLDDESQFRAYVEQMEVVKTVRDLMSSIAKGNHETSQSHLDKRDELLTTHAACETLQKQLQENLREFRRTEAQIAELSQPAETWEVMALLKRGKKQSFEESERLADRWIDDQEMDVDSFVSQFMEIRTTHHERAAKMERLEHSSFT